MVVLTKRRAAHLLWVDAGPLLWQGWEGAHGDGALCNAPKCESLSAETWAYKPEQYV